MDKHWYEKWKPNLNESQGSATKIKKWSAGNKFE
jgi:hypothetical protein